jgi:membrane-bound metal-dependent hydrolase YbcI (DUF457 family)
MDAKTHLICRLVIVALAAVALAANLSPVTNGVMAVLLAVNLVASAVYYRRLLALDGRGYEVARGAVVEGS